MLPPLLPMLVGRDPFDPALEFQLFWDTLYPGKALQGYADGLDPLTGKKIWGTTRGTRHTPTGLTIMALSALENALWDLRGRVAGLPVRRLIGEARRGRIEVYTRIGEGGDLEKARRRAREEYDRGHHHQKWYFIYGPKDGREGFRKNLELVRVIREELGPKAILMFDNHSMRNELSGAFSTELAKAMLPYNPYWMEEPTAPEDVEGYERVKGETGITIAAGEHHYGRWHVKPLLDRKCLDWVQCDPDWCGGISEWLRVAELVRGERAQGYAGLRVIPHCDNFMSDSQCVASQSESLCPFAENNEGQTRNKMSFRTRVILADAEVVALPDEPGMGPDLDRARIKAVAPGTRGPTSAGAGQDSS
jgi:L-alanine-DL-glutamate epimerase-like enolase superfamily enzyme